MGRAALDPDERATLHALLARVAADRGLTPGVHPGYRHLRATDDTTGTAVPTDPAAGQAGDRAPP